MDKKTMGSFLAALRKANGLTQRELAERLGVSDKAVSRWERDECSPDLSLIPLIAEIYGITCDELLRGQRNSPTSAPPTEPPEKSTRQLRHILEENRTRFLTRSLMALGVGLLGLIGAMIGNFGFLRAYVGFFVGCVFYLTAGVMEAVFGIQAFHSTKADDFPIGELESHRNALRKILWLTGGSILLFFVLSLPLLTQVSSAYHGLTGEYWFTFALLYGLLLVAVAVVGRWLYQGIRLKKAGDTADSMARTRWNIQKKTALWTLLAISVTFVGQCAFNGAVQPADFVPGIVFQNMADFRVFAETPTANLEASYGSIAPNMEAWSAVEYYDAFGNEITEEEALTRYLFEEGNEDYKYIHRNESIARITPSGKTGYFPITVHTHGQWRTGEQVQNLCNIGFVLVYVLELVTGILMGWKKCRKM